MTLYNFSALIKANFGGAEMKAETPPGRGNPLNLNGIMPAEEKDMTKPKASVSFQVLPKTNSDQETIRIVDKVIHMIKKSGINYEEIGRAHV